MKVIVLLLLSAVKQLRGIQSSSAAKTDQVNI